MAWSIFTDGGGDGAAVTWAEDLLNEIGAPVTEGNKQFIYDWELSEGGGGKFNPLNQGPVPGQPSWTTTGSQYGGGAADYASWQTGIQGASAYLHMPNYAGVLTALKANNPQAARAALIASPWAASHYGGGSGFSSKPLPAFAAPLAAGGGSFAPGAQAGGGGGGGGGALNDVVSGIINTLGLPVSWITSVASSGSDTAQALIGVAAPITKLVSAIDWLFHPNHWIRIFAGISGGILVIGGAFQLTHVGSEIPVSAYGVSTSVGVPNAAALPLGVLFVGLGGVLLFVAFHNLPATVNTFPEFLGFLTDSISGQGTVTP